MLSQALQRWITFAVILGLVIVSVHLIVNPTSVVAYDGRCPVRSVTIGRDPDILPIRHRFIELTIDASIEDRFVQGEHAYSDLPGLPDSVVKSWIVVPPNDPRIDEPHHWRIMIDTSDLFLTYPWLLPLYLANPAEIAYLRCSLPDPPPPPEQQPVRLSASLAPALRLSSRPDCFTSFTTIEWNGNPIYLSSRGDRLEPLAIDDILELYVRYPNGERSPTFRHESFTAPFGPVNVSSYFRQGVRNEVVLRIDDGRVPECGGSAVWLVWDGGLSPPNEDPIPLIDNLAIREAQPSAQLRFPFQVPGWMRYLRAVLRKGSNATVSFEAPDGTRYTPSHPDVTYTDTVHYGVSALQIDQLREGTWVAIVDVIAADPDSVFFLSVIGQQGEVAASDTLPPVSAIHLEGSHGQHGWFLSDVTASITSVDEPGGSGVRLIQWSGDDGATWHDYSGPLTLQAQGSIRLLARAVDHAGNREQLPASALVRIDKTAPSLTSAARCARDALGVCRSAVITRFDLADAVSGPTDIRIRINGGPWVPLTNEVMTVSETGQVLSAEYTLAANGSFRIEAVGFDWAGQQTPVVDLGVIIVEKYLVVSTATGRSWRAISTTSTRFLGERSHTNGAVDIYANTSLYTDQPVEIVAGGNRVSSNSNTTFRSEGSSVAVAAPSYSFEYFKSLPGANFYSSSKTFSSNAPLCGTHVVDGDITLAKVVPGAGCGLTFVAKSKIVDKLSSVTLRAADVTSGALYVAFGSSSPMTITGSGKTLEGLILAPNGSVLIKAGNSAINGTVYATIVEVNGTVGTTLRWSTQIPIVDHPLPLPSPTYTPAPPPSQPRAPRLMNPANSATVTNPVTLSWEAVAGATSYTIVVSSSSSFSGGTTISKTLSGATSTSMSLTPGMTWYWRVRVAGPSIGPWSETRTFRT